MTNYRRLRVAGGTYFFTVNLANRGSTTLTDHIEALREAVRVTRSERPFGIDAAVVLPDHLHMIWTLPGGDADFSTRWRLIKSRFSMAVGVHAPRTGSQSAKGERGVWQRRFWEHVIRDEADYEAHVRYCRENPVKHGFVERAEDWSWSSLHWVG